jgi:signal transduction histidine kinase/ActR/RegA family two-component response regulator
LAAACIAAVVIDGQLRRSEIAERGAIGANSARLVADSMDKNIGERSATMIGWASLVEAESLWQRPGRLQTLLEMVQRASTGYSWIGMADASGRVVAGTGGIAVGADVSQRDWFLRGAQGLHHGDLHDAVLLSRVFRPLPQGEPWRFIDISLPVRDPAGKLVGVLAAHLSWPWMREQLAAIESGLPSGGQIWIVGPDDRPRIAGRLGPTKDLGPAVRLRAIGEARQGRTGWSVEPWTDGTAYVTAFAPHQGSGRFPGLDWVAVVRMPAHAQQASAWVPIEQPVLWLAAASVVLMTLGTWVMARRWQRPMDDFIRELKDLGPGAQAPRLPARASREVHHVHQALLRLLARLEAKEQALKDALDDMHGNFASVGSSLPGVLSTFRLEGDYLRFLYVSEGCQTYFGVSASDWVQDPRAWRRHVEGNDLEAYRKAFFQLLRREIPSVQQNLRVVGVDGLRRTLQLHVVRRDRHRGHVFDVIALDVSELMQARQMAEQASQAKGEFLATMSHELRTPLNAILGFARLLEEGAQDSEARRQARHIRETGETLTRVLNDVLDLGKIEAGKYPLEPQPFDMREVLESCADIFRQVAADRGLQFVMSPVPELPRLVGDPVRLRQVLNNLLSNACKFTAQGSVSLNLELIGLDVARGRDGPQARIRLDVVDTGLGMTPEQLGRVFEPYEQAQVSTSMRHGGTGLGLSIVKGLIGQIGGTVEVRSRPGEGTTFSLLLSLPVDLAEAKTASAVEALAPAIRPMRVLVVDDSPVNRELLAAVLRRWGHTVEEASDGVLAVASIERQRPDLVLMDLDMPAMDGLEATRRVRSREGADDHLPIVALTGKAFAEDIARTRDAGMDSHLVKPVQLEALQSVLVAHAGSRALDRS